MENLRDKTYFMFVWVMFSHQLKGNEPPWDAFCGDICMRVSEQYNEIPFTE